MKNIAPNFKQYARFPLFQSHLDVAHSYWASLIKIGDIVIDATCGNGHDSLMLANMALSTTSGYLYCLDIQALALENTANMLKEKLPQAVWPRICFKKQCHSNLSAALINGHVPKMVVYNLGYLPGGDKNNTTLVETTLQSIKEAEQLVVPGGAISIMCYPGHLAGRIEEEALLAYVASLPANLWSSSQHRWLNRQKSPSLLLLQKALCA